MGGLLSLLAPHYAGDAFLGHGGVRTLGRRWRLTAAAPGTGKGCCPDERKGDRGMAMSWVPSTWGDAILPSRASPGTTTLVCICALPWRLLVPLVQEVRP